MKKQIRQGVFETNSSSTHSICIAKNTELTIPKSLHFEFGEFGWEFNTLQSLNEKASYLYTGLIANKRDEDVENIIQLLENKGINVTSEKPIYKIYTYEGNEYVDTVNGGYVDHSSNLKIFLDDICKDENKLMNYLFSDLSFILTGNDNSDNEVNIDVEYPYYEYFKGN